ncbi:MAG TPA: LodA/GoxA family CTQ-dependent oxidase [Blastocatellia bacterium]|nr:LodA/GoxA family CTQ-dependent oxidase [Blastocatellia bacterium]
MTESKRRDIFLKIEPLGGYSPLAPIMCARHYGRDCMFGEGHEYGRLTPAEIFGATLDALVYREYLDPDYTIHNTKKIIESDANEPPWDRRVPGTVLYARPGERLYIHVLNGDRDCHSFHLHGLKYGIDSDGAWPFGINSRDGRRSDEILPGQRWTYIFDATPETIGAWAFHDHVRQVQGNVNRGLFGGLIVRDPAAECADHEIPLFVHLMEGGGTGCQFQSPTLTGGQVFSFVFSTQPGICNYFCRIHGTTMSGQVRVIAGGPAAAAVEIHDNFFLPAVVDIGPGGTVTWTHKGESAHIVFAGGGGASTFCLNGRAYVGNTPTIVADAGERLRWYVFNLDLGGIWHNFHPHSTRWQLPAPQGGASDVHSLSPVESFVTDTEAPPALRLPCILEELQCDPPPDACRVRIKGDFLFHCHIEEHMMQGLAGLLRSREYIWITREVAKQLAIELPYDDGSNDCSHVDIFRCRPRRTHYQLDQPASVPGSGGMHMTTEGSTPATAGMPGMGGMGGMGGGATIGASMDIADAATKGMWELLPCDSQVLAVHAALLHTGKVLFFAGSGNDELYTTGLRSVVWDYENGSFHQPVTPIDVFCAHQSFLADGRLLVVGGTETYAFTGLRTAYAFDPATENWIRLGDMSTGRWYPVAVTLGDGRVLAAGGTGDLPHQVEIYSPLTGWAPPIARTHDWGQYANLLLLRDGRVFFTGAHFDGFARAPFIFDVATHVETPVPGLSPADSHGMAPSVLLPPAQAQKAMVFGGGGPVVSPDINLIDLSVAAPHFVPGPPMSHARMMQNAVILPDRTVFVSGGGLSDTPPISELRSEIYDPAANAWRPGATALVPRLYHSVALLLPDGRVITAGSNSHRRDDELRLELYHPPYLFKGPRPFIENAPTEVRYGRTIEIHTPQADQIKWVQLIRPMATTHSCDTEQRLVDLKFKVTGFCKLKAVLPREANLAPPGWYMLFIVDHQGVPSVASWVHLEMDAQLRAIKSIKINSSIGIARVGNSPDEFFIGPEKPGDRTPPTGGYKDAQGRIKRQAARFRLFGYDEGGRLVKEITDDDATISWTVHLANKKAEWKEFDGLNADAPRRNGNIRNRKTLIIDPGPRTITGLGETARFDTGKFKDTVVPLGEIRTDEEGRLLVLGGFGHSDSPHNKELTDYANNDDWYDDVSDGPVNATITFHGGATSIEAVGAWVIVAVPDFAPEIDSITTLYDTLRRVAVEKLGMKLPAQPSFTNDIYPILRRAIQMTWIGKHVSVAHMTLPSVIPPPGSKSDREAIFSHLRNPNDGSGGDMPMLFSDTGDPNAALNRLQYSFMEKWRDGDFINDWTGPPEPSDEITPEGLDRAALEACVGGAFYPGIEAGWFMRDVNQYSEPFRLDQTYVQAGDITKQMALPWQADFYECRTDGDFSWWPAQRPDDVFVEGEEEPVPWTRKLVTSKKTMVKNWHRLGFVVKKDERFVEDERT